MAPGNGGFRIRGTECWNRKKEPKPKKANTPKKRESYRVEVEPGESRIMWCPRPMLVTAPAWLAEWFR